MSYKYSCISPDNNTISQAKNLTNETATLFLSLMNFRNYKHAHAVAASSVSCIYLCVSFSVGSSTGTRYRTGRQLSGHSPQDALQSACIRNSGMRPGLDLSSVALPVQSLRPGSSSCSRSCSFSRICPKIDIGDSFCSGSGSEEVLMLYTVLNLVICDTGADRTCRHKITTHRLIKH